MKKRGKERKRETWGGTEAERERKTKWHPETEDQGSNAKIPRAFKSCRERRDI